MNYNEMFIENNLPAVLTKDELMRYFENYRNGDEKARQIIIYHNIRLVLYEVRKRFCNTMHDEKDLVSIGLIGLIKSVDGFDLSRNIEFMTYATRCIDNEILLYLRGDKKKRLVDSLDVTLYSKYEKTVFLKDVLKDESFDIVLDYEYSDSLSIIREIVESLPERDRQIVMLYFGFIDDKQYSQKEISEMLSITQSYVSRILKYNMQILKVKIVEAGIIENNFDDNAKRLSRK